MTEPGAAEPGPSPAPSIAPAAGDPAATAPPAERPMHLYEAASAQRDKVMTSFDAQRAAILKAVADQREAALAPIRAVRARRVGQAAANTASLFAGGIPSALGKGVIMGRSAYQPSLDRGRMIAAEIVATIKTLVAEEVKFQLRGRQEAATGGAAASGA
jgi:hypothetical protein